MTSRFSLLSAAPLVLILASANPAFAAPTEATLDAYGLTATKGGGLSYGKRTIEGSRATYSDVVLQDLVAKSLIVETVSGSGPPKITSAVFSNLSTKTPQGRTLSLRSLDVRDPSPQVFKGPLKAVMKSDADALASSGVGMMASSITFEGLQITEPDTGVFDVGRIRLDGLDLTADRAGFSRFEIAEFTVAGTKGEKFALGRFMVRDPNEKLMRALASAGKTKPADASAEQSGEAEAASAMSAFDGASAREWRIEGVAFDLPKPPPAPPSDTAKTGETKVSYSLDQKPGDKAAPEVPDPDEATPAPNLAFGPITFRLATFAIEDQEGDKIGRVALEGLKLIGEAPIVETFDLTMGGFVVDKLDLGPFVKSFRAGMAASSARAGKPDPANPPMTKTPPGSGLELGYEGIALKDFRMGTSGVELDLGSFAITTRKDSAARIVGVDTSAFDYAFKITNPTATFGAIAKATLDTMGYSEIRLTGPASRTDYNPATDEATYPGGTFGMKNGFLATISYSVLGLRDYLDAAYNLDPAASASPAASAAQVLSLVSLLKIKNLSFTFEDQSLVGRIARVLASQDGKSSPEQIRASWVRSAEAAAQKQKPGTVERLLATSAANFFRTPNRTLSVSLTPPKPISVADFSGKGLDPKALGLAVTVK